MVGQKKSINSAGEGFYLQMRSPRRENSQSLSCVHCRMCMRDSKRSCHQCSAGQWQRDFSQSAFLNAELARMMESNSRNIILNYNNFVLSSRMSLKTTIEDENGLLKDGLMDFIATRAEPNMLLHKFDHVMEKMKQAWSDISREEIERLSNAFQRARENQEKYWETRFSEHVQALDDLCSNSSSSSSSSSAENVSLLQCAKELVECWKTRM